MTTFKANRKFPNPITVTDEPRSHTLALQQIIEALNVGQRRTREIGSSYVRVSELVDVGLIEIVGNQLKLTNLGQSVAAAPGASALADLTDVDLTGLTNGDVLIWNSTTSMWEPGTAGGGAPPDTASPFVLAYEQTFDNTQTGWTADAGAWTSNVGYVETVPGSSVNHRIKYDNPVPQAQSIIECEIWYDNASALGVSNVAVAGIKMQWDGVGTGDTGAKIEWTNKASAALVGFETQAVANYTRYNCTAATDTWHKLRIVMGFNSYDIYLNDVFIGLGYCPGLNTGDPRYVGLFCYQGTFRFRNFKVYRHALPEETIAVSLAPVTGADMYDVSLSDLADVSIYMPSDGDVLTYDASTGIWVPGAPASSVYPAMTPPLAADFTWVNQAAASATDKIGRMVMTIPSAAGLRGLVKTAPATPYTVTMACAASMVGTGSSSQVTGLILRNSGSGLIRSFYLVNDTGANYISIGNWSSATVSSAVVYGTNTSTEGGLVWMRITDDGTDRKFFMSSNGRDWAQLYTDARTTYVTADQVGIIGYNNIAGTTEQKIAVLHFYVANSVLGDEA